MKITIWWRVKLLFGGIGSQNYLPRYVPNHHQITIKSPWNHHQITMKSPSNHHQITIKSPWNHHEITIKSPSNHHEITMKSPFPHRRSQDLNASCGFLHRLDVPCSGLAPGTRFRKTVGFFLHGETWEKPWETWGFHGIYMVYIYVDIMGYNGIQWHVMGFNGIYLNFWYIYIYICICICI